jgi:hypothetical protein
VPSCAVGIRDISGKIEKWFYDFRKGDISITSLLRVKHDFMHS